MEIKQYLEKKKAIHTSLLNYLDDGNDENDLLKLFNDSKIGESRNELKSILQIINAIVQNHHRTPDFFQKIEKILSYYLSNIKQFFSSSEVFKLFSPNQKILLFFYKNNLISDNDLLNLPISYIGYFYPEIKSKIKQEKLTKIYEDINEILDNFNLEDFDEKRQIGENDSYICKLIREDSVQEFIRYVNQNNFPLNGEIKRSIFETNQFLIENYKRYWSGKRMTLIEYAFFFGSIQIVKYLQLSRVELTYELWPYAIHSNNPELIHLLEENNLIPPESLFFTRENAYIPKNGGEYMKKVRRSGPRRFYHENEEEDEEEDDEEKKKTVWEHGTFKTSLVQSIECHHVDVYDYIKNVTPEMKPERDMVNEYYKEKFKSDSRTDVTFSIFRYFNYSCFPDQISNENLFYLACKYDYPSIVELLLKNKMVDVNTIIVFD